MKRNFSVWFLGAMFAELIALIVVAVPEARSQAAQDAQQKAASIFAAAADAAGGGALAKIDGLEMVTRRVAFLTGKNQAQSEADLRLIYPAQMRLEVKIMETQTIGGYGSSGTPIGGGGPGGGPVSPVGTTEHSVFAYREGCDGNVSWRKTAAQVPVDQRPMSKQTQFRIDIVGALGLNRRALEGKLTGTYLGEQQVQGHQVQVVNVPDEGAKLFFDPQTHLLIGAAYSMPIGEITFDAVHWWADILKITVEVGGRDQIIWWEDFKRVKFKSEGNEMAVQFPYKWTGYTGGTKYLEEKVNNLKLNGKQNPKIFAIPK
jgi:hypothetical protein